MPWTDAHAPKNLVTEDYQYVTSMDLDEKPPMMAVSPAPGVVYFTFDPSKAKDWLQQRNKLFALFKDSPEHVNQDSHTCDHCGAHFRYCAIMRYKPTGNCLIIGETCLENRFARATTEFQDMRRQAQLDRDKHRILEARKAFAEKNPDLTFLAFGDIPVEIAWNSFLQDLARKLRIYGELSEKQIEAARRTIVKSYEGAKKHDENEIKRAEEKANAQPVITGRIEITGLVLSVREPAEDAIFPSWKMLVRDDRGFKVWGSVPIALCRFVNASGHEVWLGWDSIKDHRISFVGTVEQSKDDPTFGFYSRPTNARRLE